MTKTQPTVGLFVTCLVDAMRPVVGFSAVKLLEDAGCTVDVPMAQTCCGQPAFNAGDRENAKAIAEGVIEVFSEYDYVVAPSGSCAGQIKIHYPELFDADPVLSDRARALADKTFELMSFLHDVRGVTSVAGAFTAKATYHDSCSGLRELGVKAQPRALLSGIEGLELVEGDKAERCCGFGGLFSVKYPEISARMADEKITDAEGTNAELVLGGDLGCLLNIAGRAHREGKAIAVRHAAEVLAGMTAHAPPIGEAEEGD